MATRATLRSARKPNRRPSLDWE